MGLTGQRTIDSTIKTVRRFMLALGARTDEWEPHDLRQFRDLHVDWLAVQDQAVRSLRASGYSDREIGEALGITQQAVSKRWPGDGRFVGAAGRYRSNKGQQGGS